MTKKDYIKISSAIWRSGFIKDKNAIRQKAKEDMRRLIVNNLISELKDDNPKFDADKFTTACGLSEFRVNQSRVNQKIAAELDTGDCDNGEHPAIKSNGVCMSCGLKVS